jgi:hypothetical protein
MLQCGCLCQSVHPFFPWLSASMRRVPRGLGGDTRAHPTAERRKGAGGSEETRLTPALRRPVFSTAFPYLRSLCVCAVLLCCPLLGGSGGASVTVAAEGQQDEGIAATHQPTTQHTKDTEDRGHMVQRQCTHRAEGCPIAAVLPVPPPPSLRAVGLLCRAVCCCVRVWVAWARRGSTVTRLHSRQRKEEGAHDRGGQQRTSCRQSPLDRG